METLKVKIVGRRFNHVKHEVKSGYTVDLIAEEDNQYDSDALAAYTMSDEKIGHVANSQTTISSNNRKNGTISASELKNKIDFSGKKVFAIVDRAFPSCIYLNVTGQVIKAYNKEQEIQIEIFAIILIVSVGLISPFILSLYELFDSLIPK